MYKQTLYVDYASGKFESWFYSDGTKYTGIKSYAYEDILKFKRKNDFTDIILTDEARQMNRR